MAKEKDLIQLKEMMTMDMKKRRIMMVEPTRSKLILMMSMMTRIVPVIVRWRMQLTNVNVVQR